KFVDIRVPYPLGFFTKNVDGRIDDTKAGWKGRAFGRRRARARCSMARAAPARSPRCSRCRSVPIRSRTNGHLGERGPRKAPFLSFSGQHVFVARQLKPLLSNGGLPCTGGTAFPPGPPSASAHSSGARARNACHRVP